MNVDRVFIDTNVLISALIFRTGNEATLLELADQGLAEILLCSWVIREAREVFEDKFKDRVQVLEDYLSGARYEVVGEPAGTDLETAARLIRDPDDVPVLAAALTSKPDFVLTGDKHLLGDAIRRLAPTCRCAEYLAQRIEPED